MFAFTWDEYQVVNLSEVAFPRGDNFRCSPHIKAIIVYWSLLVCDSVYILFLSWTWIIHLGKKHKTCKKYMYSQILWYREFYGTMYSHAIFTITFLIYGNYNCTIGPWYAFIKTSSFILIIRLWKYILQQINGCTIYEN